MSVFLTKPLLKENHQSWSQSGEIVLNQILGTCSKRQTFYSNNWGCFLYHRWDMCSTFPHPGWKDPSSVSVNFGEGAKSSSPAILHRCQLVLKNMTTGFLGRGGICQSGCLVYFTDRTFKHVWHPKVWLFTQILPMICGQGLPPASLIQTT